jgi:hypothetical protein
VMDMRLSAGEILISGLLLLIWLTGTGILR